MNNKPLIELYGGLKTYVDNLKKGSVEFKQGMTVRNVIRNIDIPDGSIAVVVINGKIANLETVIEKDDVIQLFPPISGG